jgi:hypothetical protein
VIREHGYDFDLFDDDAVPVLDPGRFPVVVLPFASDVPETTLAWLRAAQERGTRVIAVGGGVDVGTRLGAPTDLAEALLATFPPDVAVTPRSGAVGAVHRRLGTADVYLVANTGPETERVDVRLRDQRTTVERWDPLTGEVLARGSGAEPVPLPLQAYQAAVLVAFDGNDPADRWAPAPDLIARALDGPWTVRLPVDAPPAPVSLPHRWEDDAELRAYAGTAVYETSFELDAVPEAADLDLGPTTQAQAGAVEEIGLRGRSFRAAVVPPVGEIAEVVVNGTPAGVVWGTPYRLAIGAHLQPGTNTLQLRVSNTAAGALAADPHVAERAEASARRYGRRFRMQDLDLASAGLASGLLSVPRLLVAPKSFSAPNDVSEPMIVSEPKGTTTS